MAVFQFLFEPRVKTKKLTNLSNTTLSSIDTFLVYFLFFGKFKEGKNTQLWISSQIPNRRNYATKSTKFKSPPILSCEQKTEAETFSPALAFKSVEF